MYEKYEKVLERTLLFKGISTDGLESMFACLQPKLMEYKKNEQIAIAGMKCEGIGVVLSGSATLSKESIIGNRVIIDILKPSNMFGETSKFSGYDMWPATITAEENTTVMFISADRFLGNCQNACPSHKALIYNMLEILANKALMLNRKVEYLTIKSLRGRICAFILENYKKHKKTTFNLPMNRADLADFLNVSRPALSREMGRMQEEGIIDYYRATIKILDIDALEDCLEY